MRTVICIIATIIYCAVYSRFLWLFTHPGITAPHRTKLMFIYDILGMIAFYLLDKKYMTSTTYHTSFNRICIHAVICNFLILLLYYHDVIADAELMIYCFNGSVVAVSLMILISGGRHGYFKG